MKRKRVKRRVAKKRVKRRVRRGGNAFTDFFTKTIPGAAKSVWNGIKDSQPLGIT